MKLSKTQKIQIVCGVLPLFFCAVLALRYLVSGGTFSVEAVLRYTPERPALAAAALVLFYAVKSLSVVFPLVVLEIAGGHLFSPPVALVVNCLGLAVCSTIPYCVGLLPDMAAATVMGASITAPTSPAFLGAFGMTILFSVSSALIYALYQRRKGRAEPDDAAK